MIHAGARLYEERTRKGYTLDEVAKATKIRSSFLAAIEKGDYKKLPPGTYAHGFVRNYAKFLGLPEREILAVFNREYDEEKFIKVLPEGLLRKDDFPFRRIKLAQTFKIIFLVFLALLVYIIFQYRSAIFNPSLSISSPKENAVITGGTVTITGKTDSNSTVFVNNETASLDKDGNFKKTINVFPGTAKIVVKAVNNFNKTSIVERQIEVK